MNTKLFCIFLAHIFLLFSCTQAAENLSDRIKRTYAREFTYPCTHGLNAIFKEIGRDDLSTQEQAELNAFIATHALKLVTVGNILTRPPMKFLTKNEGFAGKADNRAYMNKWAEYMRAILPKELHFVLIESGIGSEDTK